MIEALIAGERNPRALADLARGKMRAKRKALTEALDGRFEDHHAVEARILLRHVDDLTRDIDDLTARAGELIAQIPAARGSTPTALRGLPPARSLTRSRCPARWNSSRRTVISRDTRAECRIPDLARPGAAPPVLSMAAHCCARSRGWPNRTSVASPGRLDCGSSAGLRMYGGAAETVAHAPAARAFGRKIGRKM
jgi:hypothetical protein